MPESLIYRYKRASIVEKLAVSKHSLDPGAFVGENDLLMSAFNP
jgi:hypothetical protein